MYLYGYITERHIVKLIRLTSEVSVPCTYRVSARGTKYSSEVCRMCDALWLHYVICCPLVRGSERTPSW